MKMKKVKGCMNMNPIAETLRKERLRAGMTEKMLARKCGLSESYVKQVESGKKVVSEQAAEKMLQALGAEADVLHQGANIQHISEDEIKPSVNQKAMQKEKETIHPIEPNAQWSDALAHIIKRFPIENLSTGKVAGYKELPLLGKKIDGCPWEKIRFFEVDTSQFQHHRIYRNDIVMVCENTETVNGKLHVIEIGGQRVIRRLMMNQNKTMSVSTGVPAEEPVMMNAGQVKVIGQCVKVEFFIR
jgi:transcriptional regulator with XRE-family HTH domain